VLPFLARRNARDATLLLTHGHLDHYGDSRALLASGRISRLIVARADSTAIADRVNRIKQRESWRPLAPALTLDAANHVGVAVLDEAGLLALLEPA